MKCNKCGSQIPSDAKFCFNCGNKIELNVEAKNEENGLVKEIYDKYLETFINLADNPKKQKTRDKYMEYISESAYKLINSFYKDYFDELINREEFKKSFEELKVSSYIALRSWVFLQLLSGFQLNISRKIVEKTKMKLPVNIDLAVLTRKVDEKFYVLKFSEYFDEVDQMLIIQDATGALNEVKKRVDELEKMSLKFVNEYQGKLSWATIYGYLIANMQDKLNG